MLHKSANAISWAQRAGRVVCAGVLACAMCVPLAACGTQVQTSDAPSSSDPTLNMADLSKGVAATVNGTEIGEASVTAYIEAFRQSGSYEDDEAWAEFLVQSNMTPETLRQQVIQIFADEVLMQKACEEQGATVDESQVDQQIDQYKQMYGGDYQWQSLLEQSGMTEESVRSNIRLSLMQQALMDKLSEGQDVTDDDIVSYVQENLDTLNGAKRSSHILFDADDEATAQQVLDQLNNGEITFEDAAAQYSTDTASKDDGGDVGWDKLTGFVSEYQDALDQLSVGETSGLVTSSYGIHIIKCTDQFAVVGDVTSIDQIPEDLRTHISDTVASQKKQENFSTWWQNYESSATIDINDMPEGLSYDVDLSQAQAASAASAATTSDAATADGADAAASEDATADDAAAQPAEDAESTEASTE